MLFILPDKKNNAKKKQREEKVKNRFLFYL